MERLINNHENYCVYDVVINQVENTPDAIAITSMERTALSYHRLQTHINEVVVKLNSMGLGSNDRIAIALPNGPEMAVAFLAIASGATCAPLNPGYQAEEFDFYLSDLNAKALIVQPGIAEAARTVAKAKRIPVLELLPTEDAEAGIFDLQVAAEHSVQPKLARPDDIALILHTSGTTSRPKMVPLTHRNLCISAQTISKVLELQQSDRCLNVMPLFHIHGLIGALLSSLTAGGSVVCTPGFDAAKFFSWIHAFQPTWYSAVPTMHQAILTQVGANNEKGERWPIRLIRSSSAPLPVKVMLNLEQVFNVPVIEAYGMTEAAHQMASNPLPPEKRKPKSVGRAAGPEVAIMDEEDNLLATGEVGEVVIRGANVMLGYTAHPEANAAAFTKGWFRTGDQGYLDSDKYLFITGRLKEIINRGGEKVNPLEVDEAIAELPDVLQAVTFAVPHPTLGEDVATAVVLKQEAQSTKQTIRQFLFERLADFKVPSQIVIVNTIPQGPTGKLQRVGLAERLAEVMQRNYVPPKNALESVIAQVIVEVLGLEKVSIHDNFFALGGDSLSGTQVASRLSTMFNANIPNVTLFCKPTVAELSEEIVNITSEDEETTLVMDILSEVENLSQEEVEQLLANTIE
ncbi:MAG: AMP-binding protein [Aphanothece sp. CMT-3BRIN-NPC111]|jgi:acyl-CoA synthetase (AMP-forming)/AMP-acid ligase II/acyl carrier protein|nr:AMP-binding protein [Aphanothece sp. CMT-3BRIN-NPC111]